MQVTVSQGVLISSEVPRVGSEEHIDSSEVNAGGAETLNEPEMIRQQRPSISPRVFFGGSCRTRELMNGKEESNRGMEGLPRWQPYTLEMRQKQGPRC